jgi:protoporphyrin/coproporphyrin ferrochelatase
MKIAIVLFNLGGPDGPAAVEPFLANLFGDPAILDVPGFVRPFLARTIARRRAPKAQAIYKRLGGGSPLLSNTAEQANALEAALAGENGDSHRCFIAMRYWHPLTDDAARAVAEWQPDRIVLLPLYPQYSTTTTESSLRLWHEEAARAGIAPTVLADTRTVCCFPTEDGFIDALLAGIETARATLPADANPLYLFSAHGLPKRTWKKRRDPYIAHVHMTADLLIGRLGLHRQNYYVCFQSRVGPVKWVRPYTDECVIEAGMQSRAALLVPIAFVSEHSETLVELDIELRELAGHAGATGYARAPTVSTHPRFIEGLAGLVRRALGASQPVVSETGGRLCPPDCTCGQAVFGAGTADMSAARRIEASGP